MVGERTDELKNMIYANLKNHGFEPQFMENMGYFKISKGLSANYLIESLLKNVVIILPMLYYEITAHLRIRA